MKPPMKAMHAAGGHKKDEKPQGKGKGTGVNKPMHKAKVPQKRPGVTVGVPTPTQKM